MVEIEASRECQLLSGFMSLKSCDWCYIKSTIKKVTNKNLRNNLDALNIFQFAYYWPACMNYICLSVGEKVLLISVFISIMLTWLSSTDYSSHAE